METKKLSPFDIVKNINKKDSELDVDTISYDPFIINKIFSNVRDTIFYANEMNKNTGISKHLHYSFYYNGVPRNPRRFGKWFKKQNNKEDLEIIKEYFGFSDAKAKMMYSILKPQLKEIKNELYKGGKKK